MLQLKLIRYNVVRSVNLLNKFNIKQSLLFCYLIVKFCSNSVIKS